MHKFHSESKKKHKKVIKNFPLEKEILIKIRKSCCGKVHTHPVSHEKSIMLVTKIFVLKVKHIWQWEGKFKEIYRDLERWMWLRGKPFCSKLFDSKVRTCISRLSKAFTKRNGSHNLNFFMSHSLVSLKNDLGKLKQSCGCVFKTAIMNRESHQKIFFCWEMKFVLVKMDFLGRKFLCQIFLN